MELQGQAVHCKVKNRTQWRPEATLFLDGKHYELKGTPLLSKDEAEAQVSKLVYLLSVGIAGDAKARAKRIAKASRKKDEPRIVLAHVGEALKVKLDDYKPKCEEAIAKLAEAYEAECKVAEAVAGGKIEAVKKAAG